MLLVCGAWAVATPLSSAPDEGAHLVKAAAIARGQLHGEDRVTTLGFIQIGYLTVVRVPGTFKTLSSEQQCFYRQPQITPACVAPFRADPRVQDVNTSAGRYPPYYYLPLVPFVRAFPSRHGYYLLRAIEAVLSAAFLASAFASAQRLGRWALVGVGVAATPMAFYLAGTINPNGLEISADIALWASAIALARAPVIDERLLARTAIAFTAAAVVRQLSFPVAAFARVVPLLLAGRTRLRAIVALRRFRLWVGVVALAGAAWLAWTLAIGPTPRASLHQTYSVTSNLQNQWKTFEQAIAWFGGFEVRVVVAAFIWAAALLALVVAAFVFARACEAAALVGVIAAAVALGIVIPLLNQPPLYHLWQGRYSLPLLVGAPILAGAILGNRVARRGTRTALWILVGALGFGQILAFAGAARRYAVGAHGPLVYVLHPRWEGIVTPAAPLLLVAAGVVWYAWRVARSPILP